MERLIAQDTKFNNITLRDTNHTQSWETFRIFASCGDPSQVAKPYVNLRSKSIAARKLWMV
jgi:hypothetical protein